MEVIHMNWVKHYESSSYLTQSLKELNQWLTTGIKSEWEIISERR